MDQQRSIHFCSRRWQLRKQQLAELQKDETTTLLLSSEGNVNVITADDNEKNVI